jgi:hypothetical protein
MAAEKARAAEQQDVQGLLLESSAPRREPHPERRP